MEMDFSLFLSFQKELILFNSPIKLEREIFGTKSNLLFGLKGKDKQGRKWRLEEELATLSLSLSEKIF